MPAVCLSGEHNITYIQIPKTAGTSIGHWLSEHRGKSEYMEWYNHPVNSTVNHKENFSFTVVRNPWSRMVSLYFFLKNWTSPRPDISLEESNDARNLLYYLNDYEFDQFPSFDFWIKNASKFKCLPWIWWNVSTSQLVWAKDINLVIKYENLESEFKAIQDILKCYDPLPVKIVTKGVYYNDYRSLYTDETRQLVAKMFEEEIDLWKYTF